MRELAILLKPMAWAVRNDIIRFSGPFYRRLAVFTAASAAFIAVLTKLLGLGMARLQGISPDIFDLLLTKSFSLMFFILFCTQVVNGIIISLNTFYQSKDLEVLFTSPVNRTVLFLSRLFETQLKSSWMIVVFGIPLLISAGILRHAGPLYYLLSPLLFAVFSMFPVNIGVAVSIAASSFLPVKRMRRFLVSFGVVSVVAVISLLRAYRLERFINPELFANLTLFISEMKTPSYVLLPSRWLGDVLFGILGRGFSPDLVIFILLLFLTPYVSLLFVRAVFNRFHYRGWELLQESGGIGTVADRGHAGSRGSFLQGLLQRKAVPLKPASRAILLRELLYQVREPGNIQQMFVLAALVAVYLFSIAALPLNWEEYALELKYLVSFFNLGMILVIIGSVCSRLVYPAVAAESETFWIIQMAPVTVRRYLWTRMLCYTVPVLVLAQTLVLCSSFLIGAGKAFTLLMIVTAAFASFSLVSLAVSFGISDMRQLFGLSTVGRMRSGSAQYMLASVSLILFTLAAETLPVFFFFVREAGRGGITFRSWAVFAGTLLLLFCIQSLVAAAALRASRKKLTAFETG